MIKNLNGRSVEQAQFHVGFGYLARTGCNAKKDKAYMEITPVGVYVKQNGKEWVVPYSNVTWCELAEDKSP